MIEKATKVKDVVFAKINGQDNHHTAQAYGFPTIVVYKKDKSTNYVNSNILNHYNNNINFSRIRSRIDR